MNQNGIFMSHFMLKLADGFQKGLTFNVAYCASYLNNGNFCVFCGEISMKTAFDLVGDVGNDLNRTASEVAAPFFLKHAPVDFSGGHIRIFGEIFVNESFIMSQVQIRLRTVVCDEYFPVLNWIHGSWVNINVRVKFLHSDLIASCF